MINQRPNEVYSGQINLDNREQKKDLRPMPVYGITEDEELLSSSSIAGGMKYLRPMPVYGITEDEELLSSSGIAGGMKYLRPMPVYGITEDEELLSSSGIAGGMQYVRPMSVDFRSDDEGGIKKEVISKQISRVANGEMASGTAPVEQKATSANIVQPYVYDGHWLFYYDASKSEYMWVCSVDLKVKCQKLHVYRNKESVTRIEVALIDGGQLIGTLELKASDLHRIKPIMVNYNMSIRFDPKGGSVSHILHDYLAAQIKQVPNEVCYHYNGWERVNGVWTYLDASNPQCLTPKKLVHDRGMDEVTAYRESLNFLNVANQLDSIIIPFLLSYLGIMFRLFKEAGHEPMFLVFMNGTSGSLKTAIAKVLYSLFNGDNSSITATFSDTKAAIEVKMADVSDEVFLLDDYRPATSKAEGTVMREKLEQFIRYFGDGVSKDRATNTLELQKKLTHNGMAVITGEDVGGSLSSLLRCILIEVDKRSFDGAKLQPYQEQALKLITSKFYFIKYLEKNFNSVVSFIRERFHEIRNKYRDCFSERRLVDSAAFLDIVVTILLGYGVEIQALSGDKACQIQSCWLEAIVRSIERSLQQSKEMAPENMYLEALESFINNKTLLFAESKKEYWADTGQFYGFFDYDDDILYLAHDMIYRRIVEYWRNLRKLYPLSAGKSHKALYDVGVIKTYASGGKNSEYFCKVSVSPGKRSKMLAIRLSRMQEVLAQV